MAEVPMDLVYDARSIFSASSEPVKTICKKRELKFEFKWLNDILAKSVTVKAGSFNAVTHERFLLMTAIHFVLKINWSKILVDILKEMVTKSSKQAKVFATQICVLLKSAPNWESEEFPTTEDSYSKRMLALEWAVKMRIRPSELETSICDAKYHVSLSTRCVLGKWVYLVTLAMSLFDLRDVCIVIGSLATLDIPMVVDLIGIYVLKGPYCTLTMTDWFLQALSVIPRGSWGDVARRFTLVQWGYNRTHNSHTLDLVAAAPSPLHYAFGRRRRLLRGWTCSDHADEEIPFVTNSSGLLVQTDEGGVILVVDRKGLCDGPRGTKSRPISVVPAVTPRAQRRHAPKRKLVLQDESDDETVENIIEQVLMETDEVEDVETDLEEPVVMKSAGTDPVEMESRIDVLYIANYDEGSRLKMLSNEEEPLVETEKEKEKEK
ncbi:UDP-rhamnose:rhamnosyltransferase 1 [Dorcoceras hygrometricum]|uniref:UDP-rhamnose:rhamnosyltransferase 1 n=1 Tax=Dorcoceras hygrometricum TaxID=472368 RepID=A0A2Z7BDQ9_9LAMI|nr:UDP-rhamnose:rhamnosyltransferase 1 [Dorcoceras hygrometricum]